MKKLIITLALTFTVQSLMAQLTPLHEYKWENRILIIYSNGNSNDQLNQQIKKYEQSKKEYQDRDLLVFELSNNEFIQLTNNSRFNESISELKNFLSIDSQQKFGVFLIGKDGTLKLESDKIIPNQKLFSTIDAMPMRRNEMNRDNK